MIKKQTSTKSRPEIATPSNVITIIRILLVPVFVAALLAPWPEWLGFGLPFSDDWKSIIAAVIFVIISGTDWLDGYLARSRGEVTDFGKFMDPLADKILVTAALICLVELGDLPTWVVLIILAREFIVSGVRMMAASKGVVIAASMIGKFKTVFQMIAIVLFAVKRSHMISSLGDSFGDFLWVVSWGVMLIALALTIASMVDYLAKSREVIGLGKAAISMGDTSVEESNAAALDADPYTRAAELVRVATANGLTVATAESLTGGLIGATITSVPGSSAVYKGGIVSYTNAVKMGQLGVSETDLNEFGAVSKPVAEQMARGVREKLNCTVAVAVTGLAGPDGDEFGNPVGCVWIGVSTEERTYAINHVFEGDREAVRNSTVAVALDLLLEELQA